MCVFTANSDGPYRQPMVAVVGVAVVAETAVVIEPLVVESAGVGGSEDVEVVVVVETVVVCRCC